MKPRILVVEDDHDIADILVFILAEQGYEVQLLHYGNEVFDAIVAFEPKLVLMDIMLPDSDGSELCRDVKRLYPALPVILLSAGYFMQTPVSDDFIVKPFNVEEVLMKVRSMLA